MFRKIAARMVQLHQIPLTPSQLAGPAFFDTKFEQFVRNIPTEWAKPEQAQKFHYMFAEVDLRADFARVQRGIAAARNRRLVLCHNDLLVYNVLYDEDSDQVNFIDYEYTGVNYQLFDVANHFNEYAGEFFVGVTECHIIDFWVLIGEFVIFE